MKEKSSFETKRKFFKCSEHKMTKESMRSGFCLFVKERELCEPTNENYKT